MQNKPTTLLMPWPFKGQIWQAEASETAIEFRHKRTHRAAERAAIIELLQWTPQIFWE